MMPAGRPKSEEPREMVVALRLTLAEYRYLQALAMKRGRSVGELTRVLALAGMPQKGDDKN
jgi:DNA-binding MarR family transcriptional regulator